MLSNRDMETVRHLIVGSGMTGLAFANFTPRDPADWLIIERDESPGGYCKTIHQDGFVWDYSGHFFHFRYPEIERFLRDRMDEREVDTIQKRSGILFGGRRIDFPFQKNIHQLPQADFIDCLHDLYFRDADRPETTFLDMLYARFGRGIAERFLVPYNTKLYACGMDRLDPNAMGRFFPYADVDAIIRNFKTPENSSYNGHFTYPRGGAIRYVEALLRDLPKDRIATSEALTHVNLDAKVATTTKREIRYERLISSVPFPKLLEATGQAVDREVYSWNKVLVFNLGFDRKGQAHDHWQYIPDPEIAFYRVGYYDNIFGTDQMSLYIEIGLDRDAEVGSLEAWRARILADLQRLEICTDHQLRSWHAIVLDPAYVHITTRSKAAFAEQSAALAQQGVHSIGRYGGWTYCAIEDNIVEARALARRLG